MIYLFTGTDEQKARAKAFAWVTATKAKVPEAPYVRLETKDISAESLQEVCGSQGLFFTKTLGLLDDPWSEKEKGELVLAHLSLLQESQNPIAILAPKLSSAITKKLEAKAHKVFSYTKVTKGFERGFNSALVNALGTKNSISLWVELMRTKRNGEAPEAVHGLLHWKARDLMQKGGGVWGKEGARTLSIDLVGLVSESRNGGLTLSEELERFALSMSKK